MSYIIVLRHGESPPRGAKLVVHHPTCQGHNLYAVADPKKDSLYFHLFESKTYFNIPYHLRIRLYPFKSARDKL